jgi:Fe-S cluster assembly iron-binding protein IscA
MLPSLVRRGFAAAARRALPPPIFATERATLFFSEAIKMQADDPPVGVRLDYKPKGLEMEFAFDFVGAADVDAAEEKLVVDDSLTIFVAQRALMQVLGATVDFDPDALAVRLLDKDGAPLKPVNH